MQRIAFALVLTVCPLPAYAQASPQALVEQTLAEAGPGLRWGMVVIDDQGREVVAIAPEGRFIPASNTKLFTTAAALWKMPGLDQPDRACGASVSLVPARGKAPSVRLVGRGDARLSSAPDCKANCLARLADAVAAKTRKVQDVIGDDSLFLDQRWSLGMSWNNIPTRSGTGNSALTIDHNEALAIITPGAPGAPPAVTVPGYFTVDNRATTALAAPPALVIDRLPGTRQLRISGIVASGAPRIERLGIDDPADYAAWKLAEMLKARGVKVAGTVGAVHRIEASPAPLSGLSPATLPALLALEPAPLGEDLAIINKESQNLHAELLLRRIGLAASGLPADASSEGGLKVISAMLAQAGLEPHQFFFADGSGMSTYNRVAPRGVATFLRWTQRQPWGARFRATLPVGGTDGTLAARFKGTPLEGRIFAKTGTINASNALAGFLTTRSGKTWTFAVYANDVPEGVMATRVMDKALVALANAQ